jgi:four helix bundle protein
MGQTGDGDELGGRKDPLESVQAYRLAMEASRDALGDARAIARDPITSELGRQLLRAVASIGANIAEGYSRGTPADRRRFLEYALGSTRESLVWYSAASFPNREDRERRLISIRRLLLTMIRNSRNTTTAPDASKFTR